MQKNTWKEWFIFTRRDRNAAIVLLAIIALLILLPYVLPAKKSEIHIDEALQKELDKYLAENPQQSNSAVYANTFSDTTVNDTAKHSLFYFDPNTLDEAGFAKLGLPQKTIHTLINYRSKGGYFKFPEDIRKIYGLSKTDADRLIPYIHITSNKIQQQQFKNVQPVTSSTPRSYKKININTATAEDWKAFPGIGDVIANRIVKFRTSIGGFKTVDQVAKTYGLSDSVFKAIKPYLYLKDADN